jgi:hypothetical protein
LIHTTTQSLIFFQTPSQVGRKTRREIIIWLVNIYDDGIVLSYNILSL